MSDRKLVNLDFLNREAQLYKQSKNEVKTSGDEIQQAIEQNTKREIDEVNNAIKNLNEKVEQIMKTDYIKGRKDKIERSEEIMEKSVKMALDTFMKVKKVIQSKDNLTIEQKREYEKKLYEKIIEKFMTEEEKEMFEKLMSGGQVILMGNPYSLGGSGISGLGLGAFGGGSGFRSIGM